VQGQALRDRAPEFTALGTVILGASFDTPAENDAFAAAQDFPFPLLSDVDRTIGRAYGVARDDDDQYASFPRRMSFLIDPEATVRKVYSVTDVAGHAGAVLHDLELLVARP
jgi:peroxiredoxin Q/BCP